MTPEIRKLKNEFGTVTFDGVEYVLTQQAYITGPADSDGWYEASAIRADAEPDEYDGYDTFRVVWEILPETLEAWKEARENGDCIDDEGDACDWDSPELVESNGGRRWF